MASDKIALTRGFLKYLRPQIILFFLQTFVFGAVYFLTRQESRVFTTAFQICLLLFILSSGIQFYLYTARAKRAESTQYAKTDAFLSSDYIHEMYEENYMNLEETLLRKKQADIEKQSELMDYFSLWIHQIKTPLSAISLILQQQKDQTPQQRKLEQELIHVNDYIHLALNYLKLEETGKELEIEQVDIDLVIRSVLKKYAILFIYNKISLDFEPTNLIVQSDKKWVQVLIEQILSNSLKYTETGTIKITATPDQKLIIEDTGTGISKEDLPKIFEKGYTGLNGRLHDKSTGIGLFISRKITERLNITLTIDSELGKGTRAIIDFSRKKTTLFE